MIRPKYLVYILAIVMLPGVVRGQPEMLSLSSALERALDNNYGLMISRAGVEIATLNNHWGNAGRYPTIGFEVTDNNNVDLNNSSYSNRFSTGIGLNWTLFDGFRVNITKTKLENLQELSSGQLAVMVENTIEDIVLGYYNVLLQIEQLEVFKTVMGLSEDRYDYELKRQSLGGSVTYNVLQAQNVYLSDKANFMNQEVIVRNALRNLNFIMGDEPEKQWVLEEPFEADTASFQMVDLLAKMKSSNQTLKNQYTSLLLRENESSLKESAYYPSLSLGAGMDYGQTWSFTGGSQATGSGGLTPYANLRLSFDIYSAGVRKRSLEIARINEDIARVEIEEMEHALSNELFNLFDHYGVRVELLNVANENLEAAQLNLTISEEKYKSGVINSFNYRDIQLIYLNAALQRLYAVNNLIISRTQLTRITGGFLGSGGQESP